MRSKRGNFAASPDLRYAIILDGMHRPLPQTFPEYCVVNRPQGIREFRVETKSYFRSRNASSFYDAGLFDCALILVFPILGAVAWQKVCAFLANTANSPLKFSLGSPLDPGTSISGLHNPLWILEGNTCTLG